MMVLRHLGAPSATVVCRNENTTEEDRAPIPMDLSKSKPGHAGVPSDPLPLNLNKNPFSSIPSPIRPLSSSSRSSENIINNNTITNINNNDISAKSHSIYKSESPVNFSTRRSPSSQPPNQIHSVVSTTPVSNHHRRSRKTDLRWRELSVVHGSGDDDDNTYSSPDSGLHRDSPGEEDEFKPLSPSLWRNPSSTSASNVSNASYLRKQAHPCLIPLSLIRAKYNHTNVSPEWQEDHKSGQEGGDHVQTKRGRLEEMISNIKTSKDRTRHYSGDDDTSSGGHVTSSDEVMDDGPTDLRSTRPYRSKEKRRKEEPDKVGLNLIKDDYEEDGEEPCNLAYPKSSSPKGEGLDFEEWKRRAQLQSSPPLPVSLTDAAKLYGIDPDTYQQQIVQLQLTSAAMMGDPGGLLKALGSYPPWVYVGYYSQLLQSFQAQEILRQYAIQSSSTQSSASQGDKTPTINRTTGNTNYHSQSPLSPASVTEGQTGMDSDGSVVGQPTSSGAGGKRAPRAMTGRHVRTGTGASPSTLLTLRQKIEERQRVKAQQARQEALLHSQAKGNKNNNKYSRKPSKK